MVRWFYGNVIVVDVFTRIIAPLPQNYHNSTGRDAVRNVCATRAVVLRLFRGCVAFYHNYQNSTGTVAVINVCGKSHGRLTVVLWLWCGFNITTATLPVEMRSEMNVESRAVGLRLFWGYCAVVSELPHLYRQRCGQDCLCKVAR